jgi:hypothetical protein
MRARAGMALYYICQVKPDTDVHGRDCEWWCWCMLTSIGALGPANCTTAMHACWRVAAHFISPFFLIALAGEGAECMYIHRMQPHATTRMNVQSLLLGCWSSSYSVSQRCMHGGM